MIEVIKNLCLLSTDIEHASKASDLAKKMKKIINHMKSTPFKKPQPFCSEFRAQNIDDSINSLKYDAVFNKKCTKVEQFGNHKSKTKCVFFNYYIKLLFKV